MRKITQQQSVLKKNMRIVDARQNMHREKERERDTKYIFIKNATVTKQPTTTNLYKRLQGHFI